MIDTQLHIVDPSRFPFPGGSAGYVPQPHESGTLQHLLAAMEQHGISHGVLVQPSVYGTDNSAILAAARPACGRFKAIVMTGLDGIAAAVADPCVAGVRLNLTDFRHHGDIDDVRKLATRILEEGLILQMQALPETLVKLLEGLPEGPVILDHFGRADLARADDIDRIRSLSERPDCHLKVSAAFRLAGAGDRRDRDDKLAGLVSAFEPDQVLWGSDWPFLNVHGERPNYQACLAMGHALIDMPRAERAARRLFGWSDG